jgi:hypothetical protein
MTEPTMPNPRNVLDCGPADEVPVREVLSRLATFIGGPLHEHLIEGMRDHPVGDAIALGPVYDDFTRAADAMLVAWGGAHPSPAFSSFGFIERTGLAVHVTRELVADHPGTPDQILDAAKAAVYGPDNDERPDDIVVTVEADADRVIDLMAALERSVAAAKDAHRRHPQPGGDR